MKFSKLRSSLMILILAFSLKASASPYCSNPYLQKSIDSLSMTKTVTRADVSRNYYGVPAAKVFTVQAILNLAPQNEDIGPEAIGPYTLSNIVSGYILNIEKNRAYLMKSVKYKNLAILQAICSRVRFDEKADIIKILSQIDVNEIRLSENDPAYFKDEFYSVSENSSKRSGRSPAGSPSSVPLSDLTLQFYRFLALVCLMGSLGMFFYFQNPVSRKRKKRA